MPGWPIVKSLDAAEIESRYKSCLNGREKTHWHVILLALKGLSSKEIAETVRYSQRWVERLIKRFNEDGADGLADKRKHNRSTKLLNVELMAELETALN